MLLYVLSALAVPGLSLFQLGVLGTTLAPFVLRRLAALSVLFRRTRLLFLLLILVSAFTLPGEAFLPILGNLSPSREGLLQGLGQAGRLAVLLLLLDVLVLRLPVADLLTGVHGVLRPFAPSGSGPERVALRLALTLQAMERPRGLAGFRELLAGQAPDSSLPSEYPLTVYPFGAVDWLTLAVAVMALSLWLAV